MEKLRMISAAFFLTIGVFLTHNVNAQAPEKMSYQAVIRNASSTLVVSTAVGMQISILQGAANGTPVYIERHFPSTNENGLISIEIGTGVVISGNFATIDWSAGPYFIKTETDLNGGANYTISGTSQLLSVPYALHATTADALAGENPLAIGQSYQGGIIFWLDETGKHGLIAAASDQSIGIIWWNGTYRYTGAEGNGLYSGEMNTVLAVASQIVDDPNQQFAAKLCVNYTVTVAGVTYGDWYLPSVYELNLLYQQQAVIGGFNEDFYWTSNEADNSSAGIQNFNTGVLSLIAKYGLGAVRAIRSF
jgi:hypothetical protein